MYKLCETCNHRVQDKFCTSKSRADGTTFLCCPVCSDAVVKTKATKKGEAGYIKAYKPKMRSLRCFVCGTKDIAVSAPTAVASVHDMKCNVCDVEWITHDLVKRK